MKKGLHSIMLLRPFFVKRKGKKKQRNLAVLSFIIRTLRSVSVLTGFDYNLRRSFLCFFDAGVTRKETAGLQRD